MKKTYLFIACLILTSNVIALAEDPCEKLASLSVAGTKITLAQMVAAGTFVGPAEPFGGGDLSVFYKTLPAFCRVVAEAKPTSDSDIKIEVWLPRCRRGKANLRLRY